MEPIQVLLAGKMTKELADFRSTVLNQPDMSLVSAGHDFGVDLLVEIGRMDVDVVALSLRDGELPAECTHIFNEYPNVVVLGLDSARATADIFVLALNQIATIPSNSPELTDTLRRAVGHSELH